MRTRVLCSTDPRMCHAAAMIRLAVLLRTRGIRPSASVPAARTAPTVWRPASLTGARVTLLRMCSWSRSTDLPGLLRCGEDRLDGVMDRAAVGNDSAGRLARAERLRLEGFALDLRRLGVPRQFRCACHSGREPPYWNWGSGQLRR